MSNQSGVIKVAKIIHRRGNCTMWGADDDSLEACIALVKDVQEEGNLIIADEHDCDALVDLLADELGLEPDYIEDLWLF